MTRALALLFLFGCATAPEPVDVPMAEEPAKPNPLLDRASVDRQERQVLADKYFELARRQWQQGELDDARLSIRRVRSLDPKSEEARELERRIEIGLGNRPASAKLFAVEYANEIEVRRGEELATIQRTLRSGDRAMQDERWEAARREYERALHLIALSGFHADSEFQNVKKEASKASASASSRGSKKSVGASAPESRK